MIVNIKVCQRLLGITVQLNPTVSARITRPLRELMSEYLKNDAHISEGDFIRDAIREKIRRDTPELYDRMLQRKGKNKPVVETTGLTLKPPQHPKLKEV